METPYTNPFAKPSVRVKEETGFELSRISSPHLFIDEKIQKLCILENHPEILKKELQPGDILLSFYPETYTYTINSLRLFNGLRAI